MKKFWALLLGAILLFVLASCAARSTANTDAYEAGTSASSGTQTSDPSGAGTAPTGVVRMVTIDEWEAALADAAFADVTAQTAYSSGRQPATFYFAGESLVRVSQDAISYKKAAGGNLLRDCSDDELLSCIKTVQGRNWFNLAVYNTEQKSYFLNIGDALYGIMFADGKLARLSVTGVGVAVFTDWGTTRQPVERYEDYVLIDNGADWTLLFYGGEGGAVTIPAAIGQKAVTGIYARAFADCTALTSVTVPDSVMSIDAGAFAGCASLESLTLPFIGDRAGVAAGDRSYPLGYLFGTKGYGGSALIWQSDVDGTVGGGYYIPASLRSVTVTGGYVPGGAFRACSMLTSVVLGEGVTGLGNDVFRDCAGLTGVVVPGSLASLGERTFYGCASLTGFTIPAGVTRIGDSVFCGCTSLAGIVIPNAVTVIGPHAFEDCTALAGLTIGRGVIEIGDSAFCRCTALTALTIPAGVRRIGEYAFHQCNGLTAVTIPNNVTHVGGWAFYQCNGLTSVTLGRGVTGIDQWTFAMCPALARVTIPATVTSIGNYAFYKCAGLTNVTFEGTTAEWEAVEKGTQWSYRAGDFALLCSGDLAE